MKKQTALILFLIVACSFIIYGLISLKKNPHVYKLAVINYSPAADSALEGLLQELTKYGYDKDKNLEVIYRGYIRDKAKLLEEAKRLVALKPDIFYAMSTPAVIAAKAATKDTNIPIVFGPVSTPVKAGIVDSMKFPGGNITGVTFGPQEPRRLELLKKLTPDIKTIAIPYNPNDTSPRIGVDELKQIAIGLDLNLHMFEITSEQELEEQVLSIPDEIEAIFVPTDSMMVALNKKIADFAIENKIPYTCPQQEGVYEGALFSYGFSIRDLGAQAARIVHMVLGGTKPSEIPVEISDFKITINMSTAEKIGIEIPDYLLSNSLIIRQ
ncbi:MAG: hypothetical protein C0602_08665 [Denitrovibrio sp.]|nr:MAG: hypothetical protein C0602_08665 [Denitrovibrio sp.]